MVSNAAMEHHHRDFASTRRASARILLAEDKLDLNPTWQRTDVRRRAGCSLLSKLARYNLKPAPSGQSTHEALLTAKCCSCDPVRCLSQACHRSEDGNRDSSRSSALCRW